MWIFLGRFGYQMSKPPQDCVSPNQMVDIDVHNFWTFSRRFGCQMSKSPYDTFKLCIYYGNRGHWYSQIWIFFRRFGCQVSKFPLDFVSPNKIVDVDVHSSRYSHEVWIQMSKPHYDTQVVYILWK